MTDRAELQSIQELLEVRRQESASLRTSVAEEQKSLAAFEERASTLQASFQGIETHFNELIASAAQMLRHQLCTQVREFADEQAEAHARCAGDGPQAENLALRCAAAARADGGAYLAAFEQAAADLTRVEQFLYPQLKVIVASLLPDYRGNLLEVPAWPPGITPSIAPLADKVAVDLGSSWWQQWFAARRAAEERADHLRRLIEERLSQDRG